MRGQDSARPTTLLLATAVLSALALVLGLAPPASAGPVIMTPSISGSGSISYGGSTWCTSGGSVANGTVTSCNPVVSDPIVVLIAAPVGNATFVAWQGCPTATNTTVCQYFNPTGGTPVFATPRALFVDSTGPTFTVSGGQVSTAPATATLSWTTDEPVSSPECRLDTGAWASCTSSTSHTVTAAEGTHDFSVRGTDLSGNAGSKTTSFRIIETTLVSGPANVSNDPSPTFVFSSGQGTAFECSLDNVSLVDCGTKDLATNQGAKSFTGLSNGTHTFRVRAKDGPSNDPSTLVRSWTIDTVAPTATFDTSTGPREGALQVATTETLAFTADDANATFRCRLDAAAFTACTSPVTVSGLTVGAHQFQVQAVDQAGNVSPAITRSWAVAAVPGGPTTSPTPTPTTPPTPKVALKVVAKVRHRLTTITVLTLTGLKKGSGIRLQCAGKGCPRALTGRGVSAKSRGTSLALGKRVAKRLRAGTRLVVTAKVAGRTTTFVVTVRAKAKPRVTRR